ncbi:cytochrome c-type biogenesis protein CcmH [Immundisolibacter sp.]|uniref:cytochrome c-type biogenesis protein n=1 Tax=Immundisolibacter sp. TaxID=1934948 RepID=UPI0035665988
MHRLLLALLLIAPMAWADVVAEDPQQRHMLEIAEKLRCAVCQSQSVAESDADLARDMRALISEQLAAGRSDGQIIEYFRARYGDFVLMQPPRAGSGAPLWWLPPVLLLLGVGAAGWYLRRRLHDQDQA